MIVVLAGSWPEGASVQVGREFGFFGPPVELAFDKLFTASVKLPVAEISQIEVLRDEGSPALAGLDDLRATASVFLSSRAAKGVSLVLIRATDDRAGLLKAQKADLESVMAILKALPKSRSLSSIATTQPPPAPPFAPPPEPQPLAAPSDPQVAARTPVAALEQGRRSFPGRLGEIAGWTLGGPFLVTLLAIISKPVAVVATLLLAVAALAVWTGRFKNAHFGQARAFGAAFLALMGVGALSVPTGAPSSAVTETVAPAPIRTETQPQREARLAQEAAALEARQKAKDAEALAKQERARAQEIVDYVERLDRELEGIDRFKAEELAGDPTSIVIAAAVFSVWAKLYEEGGSLALTPAQERKRAELKRKVAATQARAFPIYRKSYAQTANRAVWRENMSVRAKGAGSGTISYTWAGFANNANIEDFQRGVREAQEVLRFRRSEFRWYEGADRYHFYTLTAPADGDLMVYTNGGFRPAAARVVPLATAPRGEAQSRETKVVATSAAPPEAVNSDDVAIALPATKDAAILPSP